MSLQDEASLILKLYDLRRESVMRTARDWFFRDFHPETFDEFKQVLFSEHSGHLRMVVSYWDMAAALVNDGAISLQMFNDTTGEHIGVFAAIEPLLGEIRAFMTPRFAANLEKLVDATPNGRELAAANRERMKQIRATMAAAVAGR